jgi:hypothetical protein
MVVKKSTKPAAKTTSVKKVEADSVTLEPITVVRTYTEGGELNTDPSETLEHVAFPAGARVGKIAIMVGVGEDFGKSKASVTVSVPHLLEETEEAAAYAKATALAILDGLADVTANDDAEEDEAPKAKAKGAKGKAEKPAEKAKGGKKKAEPEPDEDEDEDDADDEDGDDEEGDLTEEDIRAMSRAEIEAFIDEHNEENDDENQIDIDLSDYKKNKTGLKELQDAIVEMFFSDEDGDDEEDGEGYDRDELADMEVDDLKAICKEFGLAWPKGKNENARKAAAIEAIIEAQDGDEDEGDDD